ncbi:MAG: hypothetical protein C0404_13830, partial [Verrucomicrobia bacterium]|nr:hypothetical protein [Verrucomicrobiota bacterium]
MGLTVDTKQSSLEGSGQADSRLLAWLELFRIPNLFTVPGDPVAGFLLAQFGGFRAPFGRLVPAAVSCIFLYMMGLALNDWADRREDSLHRPNRPLPSGRLSGNAVLMASFLLAAAAIFLAAISGGKAAAFVAICLLLMVVFYDLFTKHVPVLGSLVMGTCRGLSLVLGATIAGWHPESFDPVIAASCALVLYVAAFSSIAAGETSLSAVGARRWLPCLASVACVALVYRALGGLNLWFLSMMLVLCAWTFVQALHLASTTPEPAEVKKAVKAFILGLFIFQAAMCSINVPT